MKEKNIKRRYLEMLETILIIISIVAGLTVYLNPGYYFLKSYSYACKSRSDNKPLNIFQKFQLGPGEMWNTALDFNAFMDFESVEKLYRRAYYLLWPIHFAINLMAWIFYFVFCGGFVRLTKSKVYNS